MKTSQHWCRFFSKYCNLIFAVIVFVAIDPISLFCSCLLSDHGILFLDTSLHTFSYLKTICWHITLLNTFQHIARLFSSSYIISSFSLAALTSYNFCQIFFESKLNRHFIYYITFCGKSVMLRNAVVMTLEEKHCILLNWTYKRKMVMLGSGELNFLRQKIFLVILTYLFHEYIRGAFSERSVNSPMPERM